MNWKHDRQHTLAVADDFFLSYTSQRSGMHSHMLQVGEQQSKMCSLHRVYAYSLVTDVTKPLRLTLPSAVSDLAHGASVHHRPARLPVSLALSRLQLACQ